MEQRGETAITMVARMVGYSLAQQGQSSDAVSTAEMLMALMNKDRALAMKRVMAEQFSQGNGSLAALEGPNGSTLISGRNEVALNVLKEQLDAGKCHVAIFYGGGHMDDMHKQLGKRFGLEPAETRWLVAWDLTRTVAPQKHKTLRQGDPKNSTSKNERLDKVKESPARN